MTTRGCDPYTLILFSQDAIANGMADGRKAAGGLKKEVESCWRHFQRSRLQEEPQRPSGDDRQTYSNPEPNQKNASFLKSFIFWAGGFMGWRLGWCRPYLLLQISGATSPRLNSGKAVTELIRSGTP
jgi:hypothetical protein